MQVSAELKKKVEDKLRAGIAIAEAKYNTKIVFPSVVYTKRGSTAGTADYGKWQLNFNPVLLVENGDAFIDRTVPHELAHLIVHQVFPQAYERTFRGQKRDVHGRYWQNVMHVLGADATRCHSFDVTNATNRRRYTYVCSGCGAKFSFTPAKHNTMLRRPDAYRHRSCGIGSTLTLDASSLPAVVQQKPVRTKEPATGTKLEQCLYWYRHYKDAGVDGLRQMCIAVFMQEVGMTKAGASTYFQRCKELDS